jgi:hypothetical protein
VSTEKALRGPTLERRPDRLLKPKRERIQQTISGDDAADIRNLSIL